MFLSEKPCMAGLNGLKGYHDSGIAINQNGMNCISNGTDIRLSVVLEGKLKQFSSCLIKVRAIFY